MNKLTPAGHVSAIRHALALVEERYPGAMYLHDARESARLAERALIVKDSPMRHVHDAYRALTWCALHS